jgi:hypothetical protein
MVSVTVAATVMAAVINRSHRWLEVKHPRQRKKKKPKKRVKHQRPAYVALIKAEAFGSAFIF